MTYTKVRSIGDPVLITLLFLYLAFPTDVVPSWWWLINAGIWGVIAVGTLLDEIKP